MLIRAKSSIYFVLSCARSGSTSLTQILATATNGRCLTEPLPNLNTETRELMDGRLPNPYEVLITQVFPRIGPVLDAGLIYGEKNLTYGPFVTHLHSMLKCRFVYLKRDGREVVTSLMNWHNEAFGSVYRECQDVGPLSDLARKTLAKLPISLDTSDYSRPRPQPSDPFYAEWKDWTRFEMCTWYWARINDLYLDNLAKIDRDAWIEIDYTGVSADAVQRVFDFLDLKGFDGAQVEQMLARKINSVWDRFKIEQRFPHWRQWDDDARRRFDRIAGATMKRLGYYESGS